MIIILAVATVSENGDKSSAKGLTLQNELEMRIPDQ
jgi:hypothetical protein